MHQPLANTWATAAPSTTTAHMVAADTSVPLTTAMGTDVTVNMAVTVIVASERTAIGETVTPGVRAAATASIETVIIATVTATVVPLGALLPLPAESAAIAALRPVVLDLAPRVVMTLLPLAVKLIMAGVGKLDV